MRPSPNGQVSNYLENIAAKKLNVMLKSWWKPELKLNANVALYLTAIHHI